MLLLATMGAVPEVFVVEADFICMRSSDAIFQITFPETCCTKAELATLELKE